MNAYAQTLQAAPAPADWTGLIILFVALAIIAVGFYLHRRFPSETTKAATQAQADLASGLKDLRVFLATKLGDTKGTTDETAASAAPAAAPGKSGQAGTFSIAVTGDPKADLAAIQAQYFG